MVRFQDGKPTGVYYSQHSYGAAYNWDEAALQTRDNRVSAPNQCKRVYGTGSLFDNSLAHRLQRPWLSRKLPICRVGRSLHIRILTWTNNATRLSRNHVHDSIVVDYCDAGLLWDPVLSAYFYHLDPTSFSLTRLFPPDSEPSSNTNSTSFLYYTGLWGDAEYAYYNPRQWTLPWIGMKRFVSGPTGPAKKQLVRRGLVPDRRTRSFAQLAVGIFMSLYPCCLRGWRAWVSGIVLMGFMILTILGIKVGLKRLKRRGYYRKVETEIPLDDLEPLLRDSVSLDAEVCRD